MTLTPKQVIIVIVAYVVLSAIAAYLPNSKATGIIQTILLDFRKFAAVVGITLPGLPTDPPPPTNPPADPPAGPSANPPGAALLVAFLFVFGQALGTVASAQAIGCTPAQTVIAEQVITDLTNLACTEPAANWQNEPQYVKFICSGIQIIAGSATTVTTMVKVPTSNVAAFRKAYTSVPVIAPSASASSSGAPATSASVKK